MAKLSLALAAVVGAVWAIGFAPSPAARAQSPRFEYLYLVPTFEAVTPRPGAIATSGRQAYRACVAATAEWACRPFAAEVPAPQTAGAHNADDALRVALLTLGNEGWEMVSAVDDSPDRNHGMTYLFKRQR